MQKSVEHQPFADKPLEGIIMSTEISRRDFIKFVFGTISAAAVSGSLPLCPSGNDYPVRYIYGINSRIILVW